MNTQLLTKRYVMIQNPIHPTMNHSIDVVRIEYPAHNIGIVEGLFAHNPDLCEDLQSEHLHDDQLLKVIMGDQPPEFWSNEFGNTWRHYQQKEMRHPKNNPWFFAYDAKHLQHLLSTPNIDLLLNEPTQYIVIALYHCPAHTWFRNDDGQVAFIKSHATRSPGVIDRNNIASFIIEDATYLRTPAPAKKSRLLPTFLEPQHRRDARTRYAEYRIQQDQQQLRLITHFRRGNGTAPIALSSGYAPLPDYYRQTIVSIPPSA